MPRLASLLRSLALVFGFTASVSAQLVYSNLAPGNWGLSFPSAVQVDGDEVGDEIILATGTPRTIDTFSLQYFGQSLSGDEQARIRFYNNDGGNVGDTPSPGSVIFDSGNVPLPQVDGRAVFTLPNLNQLVPDHFTWTVQFSGISGVEHAGISIHGPATVGLSQIGPADDFWENLGAGWQLSFFEPPDQSSPAPPSSFGVEMTAVPEPNQAIFLASLGLIGFAACRHFKARRAIG